MIIKANKINSLREGDTFDGVVMSNLRPDQHWNEGRWYWDSFTVSQRDGDIVHLRHTMARKDNPSKNYIVPLANLGIVPSGRIFFYQDGRQAA